MSGFGWDDGSKLVIAADEQWDELAKVCLRAYLAAPVPSVQSQTTEALTVLPPSALMRAPQPLD